MPGKYEWTTTMVMPGETKPRNFTIGVDADDPTEAMMKGNEVWERATKPRDVRVKEVGDKPASLVNPKGGN